jgi:hypothetical protein
MVSDAPSLANHFELGVIFSRPPLPSIASQNQLSGHCTSSGICSNRPLTPKRLLASSINSRLVSLNPSFRASVQSGLTISIECIRTATRVRQLEALSSSKIQARSPVARILFSGLWQVVRSKEIVLKLFMSLIREPVKMEGSPSLEEKLKLVGGFPPSKVGSKAFPHFEEERYVRVSRAADQQVFQLQDFFSLEKD